MKRMIDVYLCGEDLPEKDTIPKHYEYFFNMKWMFIILATLTILLIIAEAGL